MSRTAELPQNREMPDTTSFHVAVRDDLSLETVAELHREGLPVMRSLHIGNAAMYNCAIAELQLPLVVYDRTIPDKDTNYHPGYEIRELKARPVIAEEDGQLLTTHVRSNEPIGVADAGILVADAHLRSLREAFPRTSIQSVSDYYLAHESEVNEIVTLLANRGIGNWQRRVENDGTLHTMTDDPQDSLRRHGLFRSGEGRTEWQGALPPNSYNVLLSGVLEALEHQTNQVYHLSGPDMIHYIGTMTDELDEMYSTIRAEASFGKQLPARLMFNLVPAAEARLAVPLSAQEELSELVDRYAMYRTEEREWTDISRTTAAELQGDMRKVALNYAGERRSATRQQMATRVLNGPIFPDTTHRSYPTQYDILAEGGLYIHPANRKLSMAALAGYQQSMRKVIPKGK